MLRKSAGIRRGAPHQRNDAGIGGNSASTEFDQNLASRIPQHLVYRNTPQLRGELLPVRLPQVPEQFGCHRSLRGRVSGETPLRDRHHRHRHGPRAGVELLPGQRAPDQGRSGPRLSGDGIGTGRQVPKGHGELWRSHPDSGESVAPLWPGVSADIPTGAAFQFRSTGVGPLKLVLLTMPRWPGPDEAVPAGPGHWQ